MALALPADIWVAVADLLEAAALPRVCRRLHALLRWRHITLRVQRPAAAEHLRLGLRRRHRKVVLLGGGRKL